MIKKLLKRLALGSMVLFTMMNLVAYVHAYRFTHFTPASVMRTKDPNDLTQADKLKVLFTGIDNPRPRHTGIPSVEYETFYVSSTVMLECWQIPTGEARGTMILFHGYAGEKSSLLRRAEHFRKLGFNTVLVDFMGSGGSGGNSTTVGFDEAKQVSDCFKAIVKRGANNIYLFGTSMGAAAILKAVHEYHITPNAIILECPFGSLSETVSARFRMMTLPAFPMAHLLTFWGGVQHGYWAFSHNPTTYAKDITVPTLVLYGAQDERVTLAESEAIIQNLKGPKQLVTYPNAGHNVFEAGNEDRWASDVEHFLNSNF
jgi:uncharacterized protein